MNEQNLVLEFLSTCRQLLLCLKTEALRLRITVQIWRKISGQIEDCSPAEVISKGKIKEENICYFCKDLNYHSFAFVIGGKNWFC